MQLHFNRIPRTRTPVRQRDRGLVGDEVREKVGENAEQRQSADAVTGKNPGSAALVMLGCSGRLLSG